MNPDYHKEGYSLSIQNAENLRPRRYRSNLRRRFRRRRYPTGASVLPKEAHWCLLVLAVCNRSIHFEKIIY